jgi:ATP-dependent exoDNAse (exonuclease V) alpha subunit
MVTIARENGEVAAYDPRRLQGVTLYREAERAFTNGDRIQFTVPDRSLHVANRELGTIESINTSGQVRVTLDSGRAVAFTRREHPHLDYCYAVTSHRNQGQTADRVLVHVDTERTGAQLVNRRFAYVAVSRGRHDAQIYTNDRSRLANMLSRDISHGSALESSGTRESTAQTATPSMVHGHIATHARAAAMHKMSPSR